jgi:hypothetical protein
MRVQSSGSGRARRTRRLGSAACVVAITLVVAACQPVTLLGPGASIGNVVDPTNCPQSQPTNVAPCGPQPMVWAAINGPFDNIQNGDPYSTRCDGNTTGDPATGGNCSLANPLYRPSGFDYAIDVGPADVGQPLSVQIYDAGTYTRTKSNNATGADCNADVPPFNAAPYSSGGSFVPEFSAQHCQTGDDGASQNIDLQLYDNDGSDAQVTFGPVVPNCHLQVSAAAFTAAPATYKNAWATVCTFVPTTTGIYPLKVRNSGIDGLTDAGQGTNAYSLRVVGGNGTVLRAINDASIYSNFVGGSNALYLLEVPTRFAGKKVRLDLYDVGDGGGIFNYAVQVKGPPGGAPGVRPTTGTVVPAPGIATQCRYNATPSASKGPALDTDAPTCQVQTRVATASNSIYNGKWLRIEVQLDPAYSCASDCWWTLWYDHGATAFPTDRITWSGAIVG